MERYSEEELLYLVRCDNEMAKNYLIQMYYYRIYQWMKQFDKYRYIGIELDDFVQIAMVNFWNALFSYREDKNTSLCTYMKAVVLKRTYTLIEKENERKLLKGKTQISFDECIDEIDGYEYDDIIADPSIVYQPEKILQVKETTSYYISYIENRGTFIERNAMFYYLQGYNESEIAQLLDVPIRSVYNALYRGHKKVCH